MSMFNPKIVFIDGMYSQLNQAKKQMNGKKNDKMLSFLTTFEPHLTSFTENVDYMNQ